MTRAHHLGRVIGQVPAGSAGGSRNGDDQPGGLGAVHVGTDRQPRPPPRLPDATPNTAMFLADVVHQQLAEHRRRADRTTAATTPAAVGPAITSKINSAVPTLAMPGSGNDLRQSVSNPQRVRRKSTRRRNTVAGSVSW